MRYASYEVSKSINEYEARKSINEYEIRKLRGEQVNK